VFVEEGLHKLTFCRLMERDKVKMGECFRLGDIVKARVVSPIVHPLSWI
jgi:exosome complex component CSL4